MYFTPVCTIEGNIGSGKSTAVEAVKEHFKDNTNVIFLQEPVEVWMSIMDESGTDLLTHFYKDQEKYSFHFQMAAYISRVSSIMTYLNDPNIKLIVVERSIWTDKNVFAKMLYEDKKLSEIEFNIYNKWFDEFSKFINSEEHIYIRTEPEIAFQRIKKRDRPGEEIPLEYLTKCHNYHDDWFMDKSTVLDGNINLPDTTNITKIIDIINGYIV